LEWERAARHIDKRRYPWGDAEPDDERANYDAGGLNQSSPVGCYPAGAAACGALDLAGNALEWMATSYDQPQELEPRKGFTSGEIVLLSSSAYWREKEDLCCGARFEDGPYDRNVDLGFRVVWSLRAQE
jgi:formylglycine-generating enzyme required for sulfatase activity